MHSLRPVISKKAKIPLKHANTINPSKSPSSDEFLSAKTNAGSFPVLKKGMH